MTNYPRGSEWRRWDLHVHTPASIVQNFGGNTPAAWQAFIDRLKNMPTDIAVVAVTDYLFIDGYEQLLSRRAEVPNIVTLLPNIEFRLNTFSGSASNNLRHNFHVVFDSTVTPQTIREQLLNCLSTAYMITDNSEWNRTPTVSSLSELGAMIKKAAPAGNTVHSKSDLQVGFENITYKREDILKHLGKDCFKGRYVIGIGYSEWDQARWDQSAAEKRTLINAAHFSLISNDDVAKIAEHVTDLEQNRLNSLILHSSDAHSLDRLGQTKLWLKADPTFVGLKQVINERDRVFLGDAAPRFRQAHQVINRILIPASAGWFAPQLTLELNEGLVAIIGGRGSGKSALAEMIACGIEACDPRSDSFINKAIKHEATILGAQVTLEWADGAKTMGEVGRLDEDGNGLVRYLPQKAVEELCSPENSDALVAQIESVIFQALDETARLGASSFGELKARLLTGYEFEKTQITRAVLDCNREHHALDTAIRSIPSKKRDLDAKKRELAQLTADLPKLPQADEKAQNELATYHSYKRLCEEQIVIRRKLQEQLGGIQTKVRVFAASADEFETELLNAVTLVGITDLEPFRIRLAADGMQAALNSRLTEVQREIDQLKNGTKAEVSGLIGQSIDALPFDNLDSLTRLIDERTKETKAFETQKIKFQQQKAKIAQVSKAIEALEGEINRLTTETTPQREVLRERRFDKYCDYFRVLSEEQREITKLYGPLQSSLERGSDTDRRLRFEGTFTYDLADHLQKGLDILDRTKRGNFREIDALRGALTSMWDGFVRCRFDGPGIRQALTRLWRAFTTTDSNGASTPIDIESQLREGDSLQDFFDWFFDVSHFRVTSSLTFDDTDLYLLSPGQKGIVLLMLYLGMDRADTRPLIIDQPEDNLDNLSVYKDLIDLFKQRKRFRQIILITHNPNLVVNTDAEQVIVAGFDGKATPRITYTSGSLENQAEELPNVELADLTDGIIEKVCDILEGGPGAFSRRSKVYSLSPKIQ
jgi:energy-coupling factor transporter ATP-binding protein EcfA2